MTRDARSFYIQTARYPIDRPALEGEEEFDVCVVGAGISGCSAALHLAKAGHKVGIIEQNHLAYGASGRSGGQLIAGYSAEMGKVERFFSKDEARILWDMSVEALALVRSLIEEHRIECDYAAGHIHAAVKKGHLRELKELQAEWERYGKKDLVFLDEKEVRAKIGTEKFIGGLLDPGAGHFQPADFTLGLAQAAEKAGAKFFCHTRFDRYEKEGERITVWSGEHRVRCRKLVFAGNAYLWKAVPRIEGRIMPVGTYMIATEPLSEALAGSLIRDNEAVADIFSILNYFRLSADRRMLFGGKVSYSRVDPRNIAEAMKVLMLRYFPQLEKSEIEYAWGGYVAITLNRLPHFGYLEDDVLFVQGYSGHGLAIATLAGKLIASAVSGESGRFDLYTRIPHAPFPGGRLFRTPILALAMLQRRLKDLLG